MHSISHAHKLLRLLFCVPVISVVFVLYTLTLPLSLIAQTADGHPVDFPVKCVGKSYTDTNGNGALDTGESIHWYGGMNLLLLGASSFVINSYNPPGTDWTTPNGSTAMYNWNFGSGAQVTEGQAQQIIHYPTQAGEDLGQDVYVTYSSPAAKNVTLSITLTNPQYNVNLTRTVTCTIDVGGSAVNPGNTNGTVTSGIVQDVTVTDAGSGYHVGDILTVTGGGGTGATVSVGSVSDSGAVTGINLQNGGSGYSAGDAETSGGSGTGATVYIAAVGTSSGNPAGNPGNTGNTGGANSVRSNLSSRGGGLVPACPSTGCGWIELLQLANNLLQFMVRIAVPIAAIAFAWAGWLYLSARGNPSQISQAHGIFLSVLIGLVIVLIAWLVVDQILRVLADCHLYNDFLRQVIGGSPINPCP